MKEMSMNHSQYSIEPYFAIKKQHQCILEPMHANTVSKYQKHYRLCPDHNRTNAAMCYYTECHLVTWIIYRKN